MYRLYEFFSFIFIFISSPQLNFFSKSPVKLKIKKLWPNFVMSIGSFLISISIYYKISTNITNYNYKGTVTIFCSWPFNFVILSLGTDLPRIIFTRDPFLHFFTWFYVNNASKKHIHGVLYLQNYNPHEYLLNKRRFILT